MQNKLIVFEGIDGVGKTTICKELKKELKKRRIRAVVYEDYEQKNQGFNILKPFIKQAAGLSIDTSLLFYLSSAVYKSEIIKKLLRKQWVICDRYIYSTIAYHKIMGCSKSILPNLNKFPIIKPNFCFLIMVNDKIRLSRVKERAVITKSDRMPNKKGTYANKMETELKKFSLIRIINNSQLDKTVHLIIKKIFNENADIFCARVDISDSIIKKQ